MSAASGEGSEPKVGVAYAPVLPVHNLMEEQDRVFTNLRGFLRADDDAERFGKIRHEALVLAELANINAHHEKSGEADYLAFTHELKRQAMGLADMAPKGDLGAIKDSLKEINSTCTKCHDQYQ
jgi:cytochrome c556